MRAPLRCAMGGEPLRFHKKPKATLREDLVGTNVTGGEVGAMWRLSSEQFLAQRVRMRVRRREFVSASSSQPGGRGALPGSKCPRCSRGSDLHSLGRSHRHSVEN